MSDFQGIKVEGLADFRRDLKAMSGDLPKELRKRLKVAAGRVADEGNRRYNRQHKRSGNKKVVIPRATQTAAKLALGSTKMQPYISGQEFGSGRGFSKRQFRPYIPRPGGGGSGYFFYPAIRDEVPKLIDEIADAIDDISKRAFPRGRR